MTDENKQSSFGNYSDSDLNAMSAFGSMGGYTGMGAIIGSVPAPGVGTFVGAGIGAGADLVTSLAGYWANKRAARRQMRQQQEQQRYDRMINRRNFRFRKQLEDRQFGFEQQKYADSRADLEYKKAIDEKMLARQIMIEKLKLRFQLQDRLSQRGFL